MQDSRTYRALLRALLTSVLESNLSPAQLRQLANELRHGQLAEELAIMIDQVNSHFLGVTLNRENTIASNTISAEMAIKENKITKSQLLNIIESFGVDTDYLKEMSTKAILRDFFKRHAKSSNNLISLLNATGQNDPYLKGIEDRR